METKDIRLENLMALAGRYKRNLEFCKVLEMNPTYFSQVKTGKKAIGDELARKIEAKLNLPRGYMDTPKTGESQPKNLEIAQETLACAFALEQLSPAIRDNLVQLIYHMAAEAKDNKAKKAPRAIGPFSITIGGERDEDSAVPAKKAV